MVNKTQSILLRVVVALIGALIGWIALYWIFDFDMPPEFYLLGVLGLVLFMIFTTDEK